MVRVCGLILFGAAAGALAQSAAEFPHKPLRLIVPFAAGGPVDTVARSVAPRMGESLGQQVVVDNRAGAGSVIGTAMVAGAAPDGYTLGMMSGSLTINPAMVKKLPYDSLRDFTFVSIVADVPSGLAVNPALPVRNLREFIALARARPGELNYASPGRGTLGHLAAEWFSAVTAIRMTHVPYKGVAPAMVDLLSGQVQVLFAALPGVLPPTRDGKLRMLAQGGRTRSPSAPAVPTFAEGGVRDYVLGSSFGLIGPAGLPPAIVARVHGAVRHALADPQAASRLEKQGAIPVGSTPQQHAEFTRAEIAKWIRVAREAGIAAH